VRLNKLIVFQFTIAASNDNRTINWASYFISRSKGRMIIDGNTANNNRWFARYEVAQRLTLVRHRRGGIQHGGLFL